MNYVQFSENCPKKIKFHSSLKTVRLCPRDALLYLSVCLSVCLSLSLSLLRLPIYLSENVKTQGETFRIVITSVWNYLNSVENSRRGLSEAKMSANPLYAQHEDCIIRG